MPAIAHPPYRVLILDDSAEERNLLEEAIREGCHPVELLHFAEGGKALEYLEAGNTVDLILTDINMPQMGGVEFFCHIAGNPTLCAIPMVMMSGASLGLLSVRVTEKLQVPFFHKGSSWRDVERLAAELHRTLDRHVLKGCKEGSAQYLANRMRAPVA